MPNLATLLADQLDKTQKVWRRSSIPLLGSVSPPARARPVAAESPIKPLLLHFDRLQQPSEVVRRARASQDVFVSSPATRRPSGADATDKEQQRAAQNQSLRGTPPGHHMTLVCDVTMGHQSKRAVLGGLQMPIESNSHKSCKDTPLQLLRN
eukprot:GHVT01028090.1.p1 GENE.GHVT01028090.1~~GHVT01028090.1.p1  ORF type:complete len:152 (+),score=18.04 GHVT01028090.1:1002-1457(+)